MKIFAIIEARMTSSRLPGKVILPVLEKPLLHYLVSRLRRVPSLDGIALATTSNQTDEPLRRFAKSESIACFSGSEDDVMGRVIDTAEYTSSDLIVEVTGDNPIIDPEVVELAIRTYLANDVNYVANSHVRSYPVGMDVQVFSLGTLKRSACQTSSPLDREHVTMHIRKHPELFSHLNIIAPPSLHWPELSLTLDEVKDYELLKHVILNFAATNNIFFGCGDAIRFLQNRPDLVAINNSVIRTWEK